MWQFFQSLQRIEIHLNPQKLVLERRLLLLLAPQQTDLQKGMRMM